MSHSELERLINDWPSHSILAHSLNMVTTPLKNLGISRHCRTSHKSTCKNECLKRKVNGGRMSQLSGSTTIEVGPYHDSM